ncbi:hypothetical protein pb186bvf_009687 [Paramecium bursaria]
MKIISYIILNNSDILAYISNILNQLKMVHKNTTWEIQSKSQTQMLINVQLILFLQKYDIYIQSSIKCQIYLNQQGIQIISCKIECTQLQNYNHKFMYNKTIQELEVTINRNNKRMIEPRNAARSQMVDNELLEYNSRLQLNFLPGIEDRHLMQAKNKLRKLSQESFAEERNLPQIKRPTEKLLKNAKTLGDDIIGRSDRIIKDCQDVLLDSNKVMMKNKKYILSDYLYDIDKTINVDKYKIVKEQRKKKLQQIIKYHKQTCGIEDKMMLKKLSNLSFQEF